MLGCSSILTSPDQMQDAFQEKHGVKLGFMSAFVKASSEALLAIPAVGGAVPGHFTLMWTAAMRLQLTKCAAVVMAR
jgi:hypothetical protein